MIRKLWEDGKSRGSVDWWYPGASHRTYAVPNHLKWSRAANLRWMIFHPYHVSSIFHTVRRAAPNRPDVFEPTHSLSLALIMHTCTCSRLHYLLWASWHYWFPLRNTMLNPKTGLLPNKNLSIHIDSLQFLFLFKISKSKKKKKESTLKIRTMSPSDGRGRSECTSLQYSIRTDNSPVGANRQSRPAKRVKVAAACENCSQWLSPLCLPFGLRSLPNDSSAVL